MTNLLNPQQQRLLGQIQNQPKEKQAEYIAELCNQRGITKDDLSKLISMLPR